MVGVLGLQVVAMVPASAAALTTVGWNISKPHPGDTAVRYTWTFTTATTGTIAKIDMTVPAGTAGAALTVADIYGVPAGGTIALVGTTVTYTLATPTSVSSGIKVLLAVDGFTNTSTTGTYTSNVTTSTSVPAAIDGPTASASVTIASNATTVTVVIARSTSFSDNLTGFTFPMDPGTANDMTQVEQLIVKSNAANGYTLNIKATALQTGAPVQTIPSVSTGIAVGVVSGSFTADRWGYAATITGTGLRQGAGLSAGSYVGYTTAGENAISAAGPTNTDTINLTHRVKIDFGQAAGTYNSTITYIVTPSY
jgi:hypothetical protein